jgi:bifunctional isochorismate lyase/aryl carrier protein
LPDLATIPDNRAPWSLDAGRAALLVHDMQNYFIDAYDRDQEPMVTALENIARIRNLCSHLAIPVIFTMQPGPWRDRASVVPVGVDVR